MNEAFLLFYNCTCSDGRGWTERSESGLVCVERLRPIETAELSAIRNTNDNVCSPAEVRLHFSPLSTRYGRSLSQFYNNLPTQSSQADFLAQSPCCAASGGHPKCDTTVTPAQHTRPRGLLVASNVIATITHAKVFCGNATFSCNY